MRVEQDGRLAAIRGLKNLTEQKYECGEGERRPSDGGRRRRKAPPSPCVLAHEPQKNRKPCAQESKRGSARTADLRTERSARCACQPQVSAQTLALRQRPAGADAAPRLARMSGSGVVYEQEIQLETIFTALAEGFKKLDKLADATKQTALLRELTAQMQEAKT